MEINPNYEYHSWQWILWVLLANDQNWRWQWGLLNFAVDVKGESDLVDFLSLQVESLLFHGDWSSYDRCWICWCSSLLSWKNANIEDKGPMISIKPLKSNLSKGTPGLLFSFVSKKKKKNSFLSLIFTETLSFVIHCIISLGSCKESIKQHDVWKSLV